MGAKGIHCNLGLPQAYINCYMKVELHKGEPQIYC